eukprot:CAMPEP_0182914680 /NCGR_PEP_ID=MMETSP0034_2-20130328/38694_1 /TAXON_ID=156128 /ORGANISM="Nephroselmis pyriformis, Strain CCMP717" /LENGTH=138 /DNA_ID=CAMNT_0025051463 /DNA_START=471 /DNA_END=885 /DNA_ORIENTATION=+
MLGGIHPQSQSSWERDTSLAPPSEARLRAPARALAGALGGGGGEPEVPAQAEEAGGIHLPAPRPRGDAACRPAVAVEYFSTSSSMLGGIHPQSQSSWERDTSLAPPSEARLRAPASARAAPMPLPAARAGGVGVRHAP